MRKTISLLLMFVMIFCSLCACVEPEQALGSGTEAEPSTRMPSEPTEEDTLSPESEMTDTEATDTEATDTEATDTEATDTEATDTEATDTEETDTEETDTEATETEVIDTETIDTETIDTEEPDIEATDTEATDTEATDTEEIDTEETDTEATNDPPKYTDDCSPYFEYENGTLLVDFYTYTETGSRNSADYVRPETAPRHHKIPKDGFLRVEHLGFCDEVFLNGFFCAYVRTSTEGIYAYQFDFEEIDVLILITYDPENTGVFGLGDRAYFGGKNLEEKNGGLSACLAADASTFLYTETVNGIPVGFFRDGFSADRWHCRIDVDSFLIEIILIGETPSSEDPALSKAVALFDESQYQSAIWEIVSSVRQSKTSSPESDTNDEGLIGSNS